MEAIQTDMEADVCHSMLSGVPSVNKAQPSDWEYCMRREMQEIIPGLFLGPYAVARKSKKDDLLMEGITHIVCIRQAMEANFVRPNFPDVFQYLVLEIADSVTENIIQHFRQTSDFIDGALSAGGKVLVHGNSGMCRSAAIVIAYIMEKFALKCSEAFALVRNQRFCIGVNEGFKQQLMEYEHIYRANSFIKTSNIAIASGLLKRKRADEDSEEEGSSGFSPSLPADVNLCSHLS